MKTATSSAEQERPISVAERPGETLGHTMNQLVETLQASTGVGGKVSHIPLPMMRVMAAVLRPFNPTMADLTAAAIVMDTRDMTFDASATRSLYPSIPVTRLADVVRKRDAPPS